MGGPRSQTLRIKFISPFHTLGQETWIGTMLFSATLPVEQADALVCDWAPDPLLLTFKGPVAWYCCEPASTYPAFRQQPWRGYLRRLAPCAFFNHRHECTSCRVPHVTHWTQALATDRRANRLPRAVAVVSNPGWTRWRKQIESERRRRFATHAAVDLYGRRSNWARAERGGLFGAARLPQNYRGELDGAWGQTPKLGLLAKYAVCVCLENTCEPFYFTEKFVDAVCAGCIPVYHAHPSVRDGVLAGARWVDPADFDYDPDVTLRFALAQDPVAYQDANDAWLHGPALAATRTDAVFGRIGEVLRQRLEGKWSCPIAGKPGRTGDAPGTCSRLT
jgi:hypothetical protein